MAKQESKPGWTKRVTDTLALRINGIPVKFYRDRRGRLNMRVLGGKVRLTNT